MSLRSFGRGILRQSKVYLQDFKMNPSGSKLQATFPGFSFDDFDRSGNIHALRVQNLLTAIRTIAYQIPDADSGHTFLEYDKVMKDHLLFLASAEAVIDRDFYNIPKLDAIPELGVSIELNTVGKSSLSTVHSLYHKENGTPLVQTPFQMVIVDKATRQPAVFPEWWSKKYLPVASAVAPIQRLPKLVVPSTDACSLYTMRVPWGDIDRYWHVDFVAFLRYCLDAAMEGISKKFFSKFEADIFNYHIKKYQLLYLGEGKGGDTLQIASWENSQDPLTLHFDIRKNNSTICQTTVEFFES